MTSYPLVKPVKGIELVRAFEELGSEANYQLYPLLAYSNVSHIPEKGKEFTYTTAIQPLQETSRNLATLSWRLFGSGIDHNRRYNGLPLEDVEPAVKSILFTKSKNNGKIAQFFGNSHKDLWSIESIIDENKEYSELPVDFLKKDGLLYTPGVRFIHVARRLPLCESSRLYNSMKPEVDRVVDNLKAILK